MALNIGETLGSAFGSIGGGFGQAMVIAGKLIPWIIGGAIVAFIAIKILEDILFYKHKVRLKKIVGNTKRWFEDRARESRLKNGAKVWKLKKLRKKIPVPPDEVLMLDQTGKIVAEGYLTGDNNIFWGKDTTSLEEIKERIKVLKDRIKPGEELEPEEQALLTFDANYQPVSTNERIVIAGEMEDSEFGKKDIHKLLQQAIPWIVVITLFVLFMFGFKYYAGPLNDYAKELLGVISPIAENNKLTAQYLYAIEENTQIIKRDIEFLKGKLESEEGNNTG